MIKKIKKNKAFVILFAVTISSILLAVALGVANIAFREVKFSSSAKDSNEAFFAADTGIEYVLLRDKSPDNIINYPPPATDGAQQIWSHIIISGLSGVNGSCAIVSITKTNVLNSPDVTTKVISKGYNIGDSNCDSSSLNRIERELDVNY